MQISKRTLPSLPGGLLNRNFVYVNAVNTDVTKTFLRARAAQVVRDRLLDEVSDAVFRNRMLGAIPLSRMVRP